MTEANATAIAVVVGLLATSGLLGVIALATWRFLSTKIGTERLQQLETISRAAVRAVDQVATRNGWDNLAKRQQAADRIAAFCVDHDIPVTTTQVATFLEAAVQQLRRWEAPVPDPGPVAPAATGDPPTATEGAS